MGVLSPVDRTVGCTLFRPCMLASAQLGQVVGDSASYVSRQAAVHRVIRGGLCVSVVYLCWCFKCWNFDNYFYLVVFKTIFGNVLILVIKVIR